MTWDSSLCRTLLTVLARRPLLPEIYDMMKSVSSLVVRANATEVRQLCAQALVQFLLDYPLGRACRISFGHSSRYDPSLIDITSLHR